VSTVLRRNMIRSGRKEGTAWESIYTCHVRKKRRGLASSLLLGRTFQRKEAVFVYLSYKEGKRRGDGSFLLFHKDKKNCASLTTEKRLLRKRRQKRKAIKPDGRLMIERITVTSLGTPDRDSG